MYQDYKDVLSAFQSHGVKYLVVGGFAVIFHSQPRFTKDMDLFIKADPANAQATFAALARVRRTARRYPPGRVRRPQQLLSFWARARGASIFFPIFPASILTRHGNGALKAWLTRRPA